MITKLCRNEITCICIHFVFVVSSAKVFHECLMIYNNDDNDGLIVTCPPGEFIRIHSADVFLWDRNGGSKQCEQTTPTCTVDGLEHLIEECNDQRYCDIALSDLPHTQCAREDDVNVMYTMYRVTYNCIQKGK